MQSSDPHITHLLNKWSEGDEEALHEVTPLVYKELHRIAQNAFSRERAGHTLQPTALLNEAYAKLISVDATWQNRTHFYALAARMMRRLLVNHAKSHNAKKRGGDAVKVTLQEDQLGGHRPEEHLVALDDALAELFAMDERAGELLELHYFGGLTQVELALAMNISKSTVRRELRVAKTWLKKKLSH
ncbi:MAG: ECF-type sigma factor [Gammaproteobacteria bacterium]